MDTEIKKSIDAGVPMSIIHFSSDGTATETEHYNLEKVKLSDWQIKSLARTLCKACEKFYSVPENIKKFEEWKARKEVN